ncbi:alpha/beta hydrolase family protein [Natrarchaeobaculum aegyptiacum]|uniref:Alpha/beta hydrolase n=1 Tax=Natrarchaeobaculum aegyptiacum TaxID=745377 RepID=A0A2Z2HTZ6_9EURY|nr:alpha/beta hydrolase [Natrarchaeobaculum aegyptiacum]ARS90283.1 alpha/beta hydrolase [Natrarchaeobaculum aegyptiacum]
MAETHRIDVDGETVVADVHDGPLDDDAADPERPWFVCCHGLRSDRTGSYEGRCERAVAEGYPAVRFDFRGCGDSDGQFVDSTLESRLADLGAVLEFVDPETCVLFGSSFGGTVALHAAATFAADRVEAVVTRAPVTYTRAFDGYREQVAAEGEIVLEDEHSDRTQRIDERFFEVLERYPFEPVARDLAVPVAIAHGRDDESVPVEDSLEAAGALETDVACWLYAGEGHRFSRAAERRLREATVGWLEEGGIAP